MPTTDMTNELSSTTGQESLSSIGHVGAKLPKAMGAAEMMAAFGLTEATFQRLKKAGEFEPFLLPRPIGRKRYSGEKVAHFLRGRQ